SSQDSGRWVTGCPWDRQRRAPANGSRWGKYIAASRAGQPSVGLGRRVVRGAFGDALAELLGRRTQGPGELRQLAGAEEDEHHEQDDQQLRRADSAHTRDLLCRPYYPYGRPNHPEGFPGRLGRSAEGHRVTELLESLPGHEPDAPVAPLRLVDGEGGVLLGHQLGPDGLRLLQGDDEPAE